MLKLNASYSKKVPAEGEYSSQSYHASIEVELSDGLTADQIQDRIHETFAMVRDSVEAELHGNGTANPEGSAPRNQQNQSRQGYRSGASNYGKGKGQNQEDAAASPKQIKYLLDLAVELILREPIGQFDLDTGVVRLTAVFSLGGDFLAVRSVEFEHFFFLLKK